MPYAVLCYLWFSSINSVVLFSKRECVRAAPPLHTVCPSIYAPGTLFRNSVGREQPALCNGTCPPPARPLGCVGLRAGPSPPLPSRPAGPQSPGRKTCLCPQGRLTGERAEGKEGRAADSRKSLPSMLTLDLETSHRIYSK